MTGLVNGRWDFELAGGLVFGPDGRLAIASSAEAAKATLKIAGSRWKGSVGKMGQSIAGGVCTRCMLKPREAFPPSPYPPLFQS